jgi:hypothetical protein
MYAVAPLVTRQHRSGYSRKCIDNHRNGEGARHARHLRDKRRFDDSMAARRATRFGSVRHGSPRLAGFAQDSPAHATCNLDVRPRGRSLFWLTPRSPHLECVGSAAFRSGLAHISCESRGSWRLEDRFFGTARNTRRGNGQSAPTSVLMPTDGSWLGSIGCRTVRRTPARTSGRRDSQRPGVAGGSPNCRPPVS